MKKKIVNEQYIRFKKLANLISESEYNRLTEEKSKEELAAELQKAFKKGPEATRAFLDSEEGKSDIVRKDLLLSPQTDGDMSDDSVSVASADGPAMQFKPTQREIDLMKSVSYPLGSAKTLTEAIQSGPTAKGIVTSGDLIIDGHHRWSGAIAIGGSKAKIAGKDVKWPGTNTKEKLAAAQIAIAASLGPGKAIPSQGEGFDTNIMGKDAGGIAKMIMDNVNKQTDKGAPGPLLNDTMMENLTAGSNKDIDIVLDWLGSLSDRVKEKIGPGKPSSPEAVTQLRLAIAQKVGENLAALPKNPEAPARKDMPQFDPKVGGPELKTVEPNLAGSKTGDFNLSPPFAKGIKESVKRKDNLLQEIVKKGTKIIK